MTQVYIVTLDSRDFHDTLQNWSTVTTFDRLAPRIETWNGSKLLLFIFFLFYIQYSGRFFCIFQMNEKLCKKKKKKKIGTPFISRIKLKFLIFQYISLISLLSSLVKRIFSCEFLICNNRWNFVWTLSYMCISIHISINWRLLIY